ncbi:RNA polymerase II mediator complex subunit [Purpureocillium takamizusanense]|uniref:Mediator of RNA polymerase II transcription subunit 10 n=1 Tax=Purpureocillium takamizusanense TaxID=2060973 RepID=A0A9Q8V6P6_9HYPO|nr:RNA polymerase II mediator complex subunit [Purpureocillium takamizusanense]UNI14027.1 RNA polymerase II mediator complex subunit [Purpureocillium takamizusanense]
MAPVERLSHDELEQQLKDIIQDLYNIMVQVTTYDTTGRPSREVLSNQVKTLSTSLQTLHASADHPLAALPSVPPELLEYVENGRNPDIYTREFVELVRRGNQLMRGKAAAFASLRDVLAADMAAAMPELRDDVERVLDATGGGNSSSSSAAAVSRASEGGGGAGAGNTMAGQVATAGGGSSAPPTHGASATSG